MLLCTYTLSMYTVRDLSHPTESSWTRGGGGTCGRQRERLSVRDRRRHPTVGTRRHQSLYSLDRLSGRPPPVRSTTLVRTPFSVLPRDTLHRSLFRPKRTCTFYITKYFKRLTFFFSSRYSQFFFII